MQELILSDIQERIERSVFEAIRKVAVRAGYTPDQTLFPDTEAGYQGFEAAKSAIKSEIGFVVDIFGHGSAHSKWEKLVPRIVLNTARFLPGEIGNGPDPQFFFNPLSQRYDGIRLPPIYHNLHLNLHVVSNRVEQDRALHRIIGGALSTREYLPLYQTDPTNPQALLGLPDPPDYFLIEQIYQDLTGDYSQGYIEKLYTYQVTDLFEGACVKVSTPAVLKEICVCVYGGSDPTQTEPENLLDSFCVREECDLLYVDSEWVGCDYVE